MLILGGTSLCKFAQCVGSALHDNEASSIIVIDTLFQTITHRSDMDRYAMKDYSSEGDSRCALLSAETHPEA